VWVPKGLESEARQRGLVPLEDNAFHPLLPAAVAHHFTAFDPSLRNGLNAVAQHLGINVRTPVRDAALQRLGPDVAGYRRGARGSKPPEVVARFGGDDGVLMHEIGHELDHQYGLSTYFQKDPQAWDELAELGKLRISPLPPGYTAQQKADHDAMVNYLISPGERIANLFHAYWHSPKLLDQVAPTARDMLDDFLNNNPKLKAVTDQVRPSVQMQTKSIEEFFPGLRDVGQWHAPERAAAIFNNWVGRRDYVGHEITHAMRVATGALTAVKLGLSGFHFTFETLDTISSAGALALEHASRGDMKLAAQALARYPIAPIQTWLRGRQLRNAYRDPTGADPQMLRILDAYLQGGGRYSMDTFYRTAGAGTLIRSWHHLGQMIRHPMDFPREIQSMIRSQPGWNKLKVPFQLAGRLLDTASHTLMGWYVPTMKAGVAYNMIHDWLIANPGASATELHHAMTDIIDRTDDRMGEMIHDNTFWRRIGKDAAQLTFQAFGFTMGSVRTLAGAPLDIPKIVYDKAQGGWGWHGFSRRTSYGISMLATHVAFGSIIAYLITGRGPQSLEDALYPPDGKGGRLSLPFYTNLIAGLMHDPGQTIANRLNPWFGEFNDMVLRNRGYYGDIIQGPHDTLGIAQLKHLWQSARPIAIQSAQRLARQGASAAKIAGAFMGIQPAPGYISHPEKDAAWQAKQTQKGVNARNWAQRMGLIP
jgi:hypothetical protein